MTINVRYRKDSEPSIASYNWTDIAEGSGVVTFYLFSHINDTTNGYGLTTSTGIYSNVTGSAAALTAGVGADIDIDFDIEFNLPHQIKGKGYAVLSTQGSHNNATSQVYYIVKLRKVSSGTETEIASGQTSTRTLSAAVTYITYCVPLNITSQVNFKKGDILRITIEGYSTLPNGSGSFGFYHDPVNRTAGTADTTQLIVNIPFNIDL